MSFPFCLNLFPLISHPRGTAIPVEIPLIAVPAKSWNEQPSINTLEHPPTSSIPIPAAPPPAKRQPIILACDASISAAVSARLNLIHAELATGAKRIFMIVHACSLSFNNGVVAAGDAGDNQHAPPPVATPASVACLGLLAAPTIVHSNIS